MLFSLEATNRRKSVGGKIELTSLIRIYKNLVTRSKRQLDYRSTKSAQSSEEILNFNFHMNKELWKWAWSILSVDKKNYPSHGFSEGRRIMTKNKTHIRWCWWKSRTVELYSHNLTAWPGWFSSPESRKSSTFLGQISQNSWKPKSSGFSLFLIR